MWKNAATYLFPFDTEVFWQVNKYLVLRSMKLLIGVVMQHAFTFYVYFN